MDDFAHVSNKFDALFGTISALNAQDMHPGGFGAEIAAVIAQQAFFDLDAPIVRLGAPQTLIPFSQHLMTNVVPHAARIREALQHLLKV